MGRYCELIVFQLRRIPRNTCAFLPLFVANLVHALAVIAFCIGIVAALALWLSKEGVLDGNETNRGVQGQILYQDGGITWTANGSGGVIKRGEYLPALYCATMAATARFPQTTTVCHSVRSCLSPLRST